MAQILSSQSIQWLGSGILGGIAILLLLLGWLPLGSAGLFGLFASLLAGYCLLSQHTLRVANLLRVGVWGLILPVGLSMALYRPEGFSYPLLFHVDQFHLDGKPFALYVNTAKALAGYTAILWLLTQPSPQSRLHQRWFLPLSLALAAVVLAAAVPLLGLQWHPKWQSEIAIFLVVNLLVTCVAEESFMRLLVQAPIHHACLRFGPFVAGAVGLLVSTGLFAAAHSPQTGAAWGVYLLAGAMYGLGYALTGRLWVSVATHFTVNAMHILWLTCPF